MIKWAIIFAVIGLVAGVLGFGAMGIAKFLFIAALVIAAVLFPRNGVRFTFCRAGHR